ncbi:L,D-transpeptidase family protein [Parachryseolinea silvisoli]|uniref:L,D-transpeptidase family protein n=1 Tax=Parachryseolinea silvisoli TaxID=2873601 RepID=UPI0022657EBC|nr:L,D-transpeptidase family protein [Parachryseolinea silvisoli]MCD9015140.1 L,D-transpeptidase family protein [Parachryseolinea silvisoli]
MLLMEVTCHPDGHHKVKKKNCGYFWRKITRKMWINRPIHLAFLLAIFSFLSLKTMAQGTLRMESDTLHPTYHGVTARTIRQFYGQREDHLFWTVSQLGTESADSLLQFIRNVRYYGLQPAWYHYSEIASLKQQGVRSENVCRFEALLTDAFVLLVGDLRYGTTGGMRSKADSLALLLLGDIAAHGALNTSLATVEPSYAGYRALKVGLKMLIDSMPGDKSLLLTNSVLVPPEIVQQVNSIEVNLERWRLQRSPFADRYILVNIPEFVAYVFEHDSVIMTSRVIVGKRDKPTPELSSTIECFVTYPYWHVPRKIAIEEYLPLIQQDVSFLNKNRFDVMDADGNIVVLDSLAWSKFNKQNFPVRLRQREGNDNALGIVKFEFDNPYGIYLHDTNARGLFRKSKRAFSHGCIRMEKAVDFSHYLVTGNCSDRSAQLDWYYSEATKHVVQLKQPIPIYVRYFTCTARDGRVAYYPDLYRKDLKLHRKFYKAHLAVDLESSAAE